MRTLATDQDQAGARRVLRALGAHGLHRGREVRTYGWTAQQFRSELRRAGLRCISGHDGPGFPRPDQLGARLPRDARVRRRARPEVHRPAWFGPGRTTRRRLWHAARRAPERGGRARRRVRPPVLLPQPRLRVPEPVRRPAPAYDILLEETDRRLRQVPARPVLDHRGRRQRRRVPQRRPGRYVSYHVKDHVWGDRPDASRLRGRRARHARLPGPVRRRRRPTGSTSTTSSSTTSRGSRTRTTRRRSSRPRGPGSSTCENVRW